LFSKFFKLTLSHVTILYDFVLRVIVSIVVSVVFFLSDLVNRSPSFSPALQLSEEEESVVPSLRSVPFDAQVSDPGEDCENDRSVSSEGSSKRAGVREWEGALGSEEEERMLNANVEGDGIVEDRDPDKVFAVDFVGGAVGGGDGDRRMEDGGQENGDFEAVGDEEASFLLGDDWEVSIEVGLREGLQGNRASSFDFFTSARRAMERRRREERERERGQAGEREDCEGREAGGREERDRRHRGCFSKGLGGSRRI
jgi:hypothetical protein